MTLLLVFPSLSAAQAIPALRQGGVTLVEADTASRLLGLVASEDSNALTLRSPAGILTLFEGSPDALWQSTGAPAGSEESLSAPVVRQAGEWWLPVDALSLHDLRLVGEHPATAIERPGGRRFPLAFPPPAPVVEGGEPVDLGRGVRGLRLFAAGEAGERIQSLLLADAGLLGLALPGERESFDELVERAGRDRPLLLVVTAVVAGPWEATMRFTQGDLQVEVRHPFRLRLLEGQAGAVGPDAPVIGVVLLPEGFNLRQPILVEWGSASATMTFRR